MRLTDLWRRRGKDKNTDGRAAPKQPDAPVTRHIPSGSVHLHASDGNGGMVRLRGDVVSAAESGVTIRAAGAAVAGSVWWIADDSRQHVAVQMQACEPQDGAFVLGGRTLPVEPSNGIGRSWLQFVADNGQVRRLPASLQGADAGLIDLRTPGAVPGEAVVSVSSPSLGCLGRVVQTVAEPHQHRVLVDVWTEVRPIA